MELGRRDSLWLLVGLGGYGTGKKGIIMAPGRPRCLWSCPQSKNEKGNPRRQLAGHYK